MNSFNDLNIKDSYISALKKHYNIEAPNEVQLRCYKALTEGRDLIISSKTGSGKTLAYVLPALSSIDFTSKDIQIIILAPTQELCVQINNVIQNILEEEYKGKSLTLIGDVNINRQLDYLKKKPNIIVGTPNRIAQLLEMKKLKVSSVKSLYLDEADKLFDKTHINNVLTIRKACMKRTQVALFSASISNKTIKQAGEITYKPVIYNMAETKESVIPHTIKHYYVITDRRERIETLRKIAKAVNSPKSIIFINTKYDLEESLQKLQYHNYKVTSLSSNKDKFGKKKAIDGFKDGIYNYLLATDIAARGLQFDNIDTVINVNLPEDTTDYQHRAGRCGRNNMEGTCISIITENELPKIKALQKQFGINMIQKKLYNGKLVSK